jgi:maleylacetoacetate isomerase/maleylpyruvate isomerase
MSTLKLYNYFRSSASYRVRIALHFKEIEFEYIPVHLVKNGGEQRSAEYRKLNPMAHVPTLVHDDFALAESMAIVTYLDQVWPKNPIFPADARLRARTIQICEIVNSGIQPYQNLKVTQDFDKNGWNADQRDAWVRRWVSSGLQSLEEVVAKSAGRHAVGDQVTAADAFIIPQLFSSRRFKIDTNAYPTLSRIEKAANELPAFKKAHPEAQPDFER